MNATYECNLSSELLRKAVVELNEPEDNVTRLLAIDKLRNKFQEEQNELELLRSDDLFLLRFLRVRKFDQDRAYAALVNYHRQRKKWRELFDIVDNPTSIEEFISTGPVVCLKNFRAKDGSFVIVGRAAQDKRHILNFLALILISIEKLLEQEEFQICGLSVVNDMCDVGLKLGVRLAPYGKKFLFVIQEAMPVRLQSMNLVNQSVVFDGFWKLISPFVKEKMKKRLILHGTKYKTLHDFMDPSGLPSFLGGTGPELAEEWWTKEILSDGKSTL